MMTTSKNTIRNWLARGKEKGASHVVVMCDTWDWTDYPAFAMPGQDPQEEAKKADGGMAKIMECYDLGMDIDAQMNEHRAQHWTPHPAPAA
jgi:hypothetical protein